MTACYYPLRAFRDPENKIIFNNTTGQGISELHLPCGRCIGCRLNHAESWSIRMVHEASQHEKNSFITLTYSDENLPPNGSLYYDHVTLFLKKLRKLLDQSDTKIKYYYVGEYGEKLTRPHYHIVLFGYDFSTNLRYRGKENIYQHWRTKNGNKYYVSSTLSALWGHGHAELGEVNYNTCMYVAKYVTKKIGGEKREAHYSRINPSTGEYITLTPEQARMSRREAIGRKWLEQFSGDIYPRDEVIHEAKRLKTPRYYDRWLEKHDWCAYPKTDGISMYEKIKQTREENSKLFNQDQSTVKHKVKLLQQKNFTRELEGSCQTNIYDEKLLSYHLTRKDSLHFQEKQK